MTMYNLFRLRILIVDDILEHAERLKRMIRVLDHEVEITTSCKEAVQMIRAQNNFYNPIDVAILDYFMPGMNGVELGKKLKKIDPEINIIILTADCSKEIAKTVFASDLEIVGFITKQEDIDVIISALNYVMANKETRLSGEHSFLKERTAKYNKKIEDEEI